MQAVKVAERYLSKVLEPVYFKRIKSHSFMYDNWEKAHELYESRGDALSDAKFLEELTLVHGVLTLDCGS
jgi:hypothetical protein